MMINNSGVAMVRISGEKLRSLREQQELTQLYLATAVEVTTETISRWERAGTPNIKRGNGQKLALALEVELDELLADEDPVPAEEQKEIPPSAQATKKKTVLFLLVLFAGIVSVLFYLLSSPPSQQLITLESVRTLPAHAVPGQVFPVRIQIGKPGEKSASFLVKETVPEGYEVVAVSPKPAVQSDGLMKWINRKGGACVFTYVARIKDENNKDVRFFGMVKMGQGKAGERQTLGNDIIRPLPYHWADSNTDNIISDEEMLAVYDDFPEMEDLPVDIELVEEMWMGTKYIWNPNKKEFVISP